MRMLCKAGRILEAFTVPAAALFLAATLARWAAADFRIIGFVL